jgi:hypothetical protein
MRIAPPFGKPGKSFGKAIVVILDLRLLLHDEISQEVEAIGFKRLKQWSIPVAVVRLSGQRVLWLGQSPRSETRLVTDF